MSINPATVPIRFSRLKNMAKSPAHYLHGIDHERTDNAAMRLGRLAHRLALGVGSELVVWDGAVRRGAAWDAFKAEHDGAEIVSSSEHEAAERMAAALDAKPDAVPLLTGLKESTLRWTMQGRQCFGTPDVRGASFLTDLKSTTDAHPGRFPKTSLRMGYHAQCDWYMNGAEQAGITGITDAYIVAVETKPPHVVTIFQFTPRALEQGRKLWRGWFESLLVCEQSKSWPGYVEGAVPLDVPDDDFSLLIDGEEIAA